jgi:hypothetical protein
VEGFDEILNEKSLTQYMAHGRYFMWLLGEMTMVMDARR